MLATDALLKMMDSPGARIHMSPLAFWSVPFRSTAVLKPFFLSFLADEQKKRGRPRGSQNKPMHNMPQLELASNRSKRSKSNSVDYIALHRGIDQEDIDEDGERITCGREGDDDEFDPGAEDDQEEGLEQRGSLLAACVKAVEREPKDMAEIKRLYDKVFKLDGGAL